MYIGVYMDWIYYGFFEINFYGEFCYFDLMSMFFSIEKYESY